MSTTVSFDVKVIDGEGLPVPAVEVGARYKYASGPRTWSAEYTDGDGQAMTNEPAPGQVPETQANAVELTMTQDAFDAVTAMHELHQALTNNVVAQEDRLAQLRRMS